MKLILLTWVKANFRPRICLLYGIKPVLLKIKHTKKWYSYSRNGKKELGVWKRDRENGQWRILDYQIITTHQSPQAICENKRILNTSQPMASLCIVIWPPIWGCDLEQDVQCGRTADKVSLASDTEGLWTCPGKYSSLIYWIGPIFIKTN